MHQEDRRWQSTRRDFIKTSAAAAGIGATATSILRSAHAAGSDILRVGLVGCGAVVAAPLVKL